MDAQEAGRLLDGCSGLDGCSRGWLSVGWMLELGALPRLVCGKPMHGHCSLFWRCLLGSLAGVLAGVCIRRDAGLDAAAAGAA